MSPRKYQMGRRADAAAATRQRIVEATVKLHGERGIFGTSWKDIALEADVALGTVYKHFPGLEELVPACGELLMARLQPPTPADLNRIIGDANKDEDRLQRVVQALFSFYERGGKHLESDLRERQLPAIQDWEAELRQMTMTFVSAALSARNLSRHDIRSASVLLDVSAYRAMRDRRITPSQAARLATSMIVAWLDHETPRGLP